MEFLKKWDTEESGVIEECEFFCTKTLDLLEKKKSTTPSLMSFPLFPPNSKSAISVILSGDNQDFLEDVLIKHFESFCSFGGKDINTWGFEGESEIAKLYTLRHAVPELINSEVDLNRLTMKDVTKIGTDFRADLSITEFSNDIKSHHLNGYIFGHGLDGHFHVNILVSSKQELLAAKNLILQWSTLVVERGGMLIEENGIGKLKAQLVQSFLAKDRLINMGKIKEFFDPSNLLTIGTIF